MVDRSNGYESLASEFMSLRSGIGVATVRRWAGDLPRHGAVLDLGCGHGIPITRVLVEAELEVYALDAAQSLVSAFRQRFPDVSVACEAVEEFDFFGRTFDGVLAWGLLFLLPPEAQALVLRKVSRALRPGGRFLFTAPKQVCEWCDALTGGRSVSLGAVEYRRLLSAERLVIEREEDDEGRNHYYFTRRMVDSETDLAAAHWRRAMA